MTLFKKYCNIKHIFILTVDANLRPADLGLLQQMAMHMLSLSLNGLPSGLIWA